MKSLLVLIACVPLASGTALAQEPAPDAASFAEMRTLFAEQRRLIEEQGREIAALQRKLDETSALALASRNELAELRAQAPATSVPVAVEERLARMEQDVQRLPELEQATVTAGEFPGSIRIPGSDAALRVGGLVRMTSINSFDAIGTEDRFVTSSIPVEGTEDAREGARTTYSTRPSRFNLDLRTPTGVGAMRAFIEADFAGAAGTATVFRLRHAYGQWRKLTVGQTWSTFSDPEAEPIGIDREGLNAISLLRQAQFRWTQPLGERLALTFSAENPSPDISTASGGPVPGVNQVPDIVARLRWTPGGKTIVQGPLHWRQDRFGDDGHVQLAFLFRQIRAEFDPGATLSTAGAGLHYSGRITSPWQADRDRILFALAGGWGIGRYITDLGSVGGQDAVYDPETNTLEAIPVLSGYVGYEHRWIPALRSTATWGTVYVDNPDIQAGVALHRTDRATLNLLWSPIPRIDLVTEFLWGRRIDKDGGRGQARQLQIGTTFRF